MTTNKTVAAGDDIDSRCLKCKDVTNHTIIAMDESEVAKVQCNVCKARHKYRPPKAEKTKKTKPAKKAAAKAKGPTAKEKKAEAHFEALLDGRDSNAAVPYAMTGTFGENALINHSTFGLGVVTREVSPNKMEVAFKEGSKLLICVLGK